MFPRSTKSIASYEIMKTQYRSFISSCLRRGMKNPSSLLSTTTTTTTSSSTISSTRRMMMTTHAIASTMNRGYEVVSSRSVKFSVFTIPCRYFSHDNNNNDNNNDKNTNNNIKKDDENKNKKINNDDNNNNNQEEEDYQLHQSYTLLSRITRFWTRSDEEISKELLPLYTLGPKDPYRILLLLSDLQHPLVKKYSFQIETFVTGSKKAILELKSAMFSSEVCDMRASGTIPLTPTSDFLKHSLCPHLFFAVFWPLRRGESDFVASSIDLLLLQVLRVHTIIVNEDFLRGRDERLLIARKAWQWSRSTKNQSELTGQQINQVEAMEVDDMVANPDGTMAAGLGRGTGRNYPIGSVLLQVDVYFETMEEIFKYNRVNNDYTVELFGEEEEEGGGGEKKKLKRHQREKWTLEACVSGHVEENWIVSHFHRLSSSSSQVVDQDKDQQQKQQ